MINTEESKFHNYTMTIKAILGLIEANDIAIPEIQRPFVWKNKQVRDLMDSLYKQYPTGYIILWKNPNVRLKDGTISSGKKVLIDGQQRVTAIMTAIAGHNIFNSDYREDRIKIAFDPFAAWEYINDGSEDAEIFAVQTPAHVKSKKWIDDIAKIFDTNFSSWRFIPQYCEDNPEMKPENLGKVIERLLNINNVQIGIIELSEFLNIDVVTDIFIRINSKGTALSQGDFVMSKIAADEKYGGNTLRKVIDYFSHLSIDPIYFNYIKKYDKTFSSTEYIKKLEWLKDDKETVYDPQCDDIIRVAFMHKFKRSKLADLVSLLSGRDFKTREFNEDVIENTYRTFRDGILDVISQYNFSQFMIAIKSAGFISNRLVTSNMALDFAYTIYLLLVESKEVPVSEIKRIVQKWYVLSVLTGRYSASPESAFGKDLKQITEKKSILKVLKEIEDATFSESFWKIAVVQNLENTSTNNPTFLVYLASQIYFKDISFLSENVSVRELIELGGDMHHIFPKQYLINNHLDKGKYNQNANYAYLDRPVNISIGKKSPKEYFSEARNQCKTKNAVCGSITDFERLKENLITNCIPLEIMEMDFKNFDIFLEKRRELMAEKIREFYEGL